jgi:hypothetical protein
MKVYVVTYGYYSDKATLNVCATMNRALQAIEDDIKEKWGWFGYVDKPYPSFEEYVKSMKSEYEIEDYEVLE